MAQTIASIQGIAYRETPPLVYELPTRSTGDASHAARAAINGMTVRAKAVDLVARIPQGADSKPAKGQEQKDHGPSTDPKTDAAASKTSEAERRVVEELREMDRRVRAHEQAHMSAGGGLVRGGAAYEYRTGPDGQRYAVGGEVQLDTSPVNGNPQATKRKAERIRRAALAPADPSPQDRYVAAEAEAMANRASQEQVQAKMGTGPKTDGAPVALSPDAMPQDRSALANTGAKKGAPDSQEKPAPTEKPVSKLTGARSDPDAPAEPAPTEKPVSKLTGARSDPDAPAEPALPFDPSPHLSTAFLGQGRPAYSAYRKPSSPATRAWLNILV